MIKYKICLVGDILMEIDHWCDTGIGGSLILKWTFRKWEWGIDWIKLAQDRDRCRAHGNAVINFRVP